MWICTNNPEHKFDKPTEDYFCPVCGFDGILINENVKPGQVEQQENCKPKIIIKEKQVVKEKKVELPPKPMALLQIIIDDKKFLIAKILKSETIVGRIINDADIAVNDDFISRMHFKIIISKNKVSIQDLGSRNGTYVNTIRIDKKTTIKSEDLIKAGHTFFRITKI